MSANSCDGTSGWVDDGTVVRLETASDSVGIGTTTPELKLDVAGNAQIAGSLGVGTLPRNGISLDVRGLVALDQILLQDYDGSDPSRLLLRTWSGLDALRVEATNTERKMIMDMDWFSLRRNKTWLISAFGATGNVGIGTENPQRKLHVNDVMRLEPRATAPTNPSKGDIYMSDTTNKLMVYDGSAWQACW